MKRVLTAAVSLGLALVSYFVFPGHTWLQQDSQIYMAILEHQREPAVLRNDIVAQHPHVAYTLYDEIARALRRATGLGFHEVLAAQQIAARALGIWGLWLMAGALGLSAGAAWVVAMICALGAMAAGPQVLTFEYEPSPRALALPLAMCAMGLAARRRYWGAGIAGAAAFLYHPPTALPFWAVLAVLLAPREERARAWHAFVPLAAAAVLLAIAARGEPADPLFARLTPLQEQLQRMRAAYLWISLWPRELLWRYAALFVLGLAAAARIARRIPLELRVFAFGLPALGMLSMPLSWLLLEQVKWAAMPQIQPLRWLLFVVLMAQFFTAAAGAVAAREARWLEAAAWFFAAYAAPLPLIARPLAVAVALAALAIVAARRAPVLAAAAFVALPLIGGIVNYPRLHTPELEELEAWARASTPRDAVFLFADAGHGLAPGIFRAEALRAVYVDWKGGGQVNYSRAFAEDWWFRWQQTVGAGFDPAALPRYEALAVGYVAVSPRNRLPRAPAFENGAYVVYGLR